MRVTEHHRIEALAAAARREPTARVLRRLFAVVQAARGRSAVEIAAALGVGRRTVQAWVESYNRDGLDGLRDKPGRGRRTALSPRPLEDFLARIIAGPTEANGGVCTLRGKDAKRILEEQFGVVQSLCTAYLTLRPAGLTALRPRPRHPKSDPLAMAEWEASAPFLSGESLRKTRAKRSRSGLRTKRGSDNKAR